MGIVLLLAAGIIAIILAAELFTNAVEWLGYALKLASGATGSLLAAIGTSLPETVVPVAALLQHRNAGNNLAAGAILGAPFLLYTLALFMTGIALLLFARSSILTVPVGQLRRDATVFLTAFTIAIAAAFLPHGLRPALALILLALYAGYVVRTLSSGEPVSAAPEPLHLGFAARSKPPLLVILLQLGISLVLLGLGAEVFIRGIEQLGPDVHIPAVILALLLVPIATELPETLNSVSWIRGGADSFAIGNIMGSAVFQACLLGALGIIATPWHFNPAIDVSVTITWITAMLVTVTAWRGRIHGALLSLTGLGWIGYLATVIASGGRF